jgi:hypothetical protein
MVLGELDMLVLGVEEIPSLCIEQAPFVIDLENGLNILDFFGKGV